MSLSLAEIKRAKVTTFRDVADALDGMASANQDMKRGIERLPTAGDAWKGVSGDAAHHELTGFGKTLDGSAEAQHGAASRIRRAADEFEGVQQLLKKIENDAASGKFTLNYDTGEVTPPKGEYDKNELDYLTNTLKQIRAAGDTANADLEAAVKAAKELPDPAGAGATLPTTPTSTVKPGGPLSGLQNFATANPDGEPGATKAAAAGGDTQANYKEWYPKTAAPAGDKLTMDPTKAGSLTGSMGAMEKNRPPPDKYKPAWGEGVLQQVADGVNGRTDAVIGAFNDARNLVGLGGEGAPGVADSWKDLAGSAGEGIKEHLTTPPIVGIVDGLKHNIDEPTGQYVGEKLFDGGALATTAPIGGEGAALRHELVDGLDSAPGHTPAPHIDHSSPSVDLPTQHVPGPLHQDSPLFDGYQPTPPGPEFSTPGGGLHYPDDSLPSKPYAVSGTVVDNAQIPKGTVLDRFGYPGGAWLSPEGVPFAERALPPGSAEKPYYQYVVNDPSKLPPGWSIEESKAAPWFHQPGQGTQYRIVSPTDETPSVQTLIDWGYLREAGR